MKKRAIILSLCSLPILGIVALGTVFAAAGNLPFSDVSPDAFYARAMENLGALGIIHGFEDGTAGPLRTITRGEAATLLDRYDRKIIRSLFERIEAARSELDMGTCGDRTKQRGEECDDGNATDRDGCSAECFTETLTMCPGGYSIGEWFPSDDGCNSCTCTVQGIACTSRQCSEPEESPTASSAPADSCEPIICPNGSSHPTCTEQGSPIEYFADPCSLTPPPSSSTTPPECGNGICELKENELPPDRRFHCPQDCTGETASPSHECEPLTSAFHELADTFRACTSEEDCQLFEQSCPFLTCGEPISKRGVAPMTMKAKEALDACRREGVIRECALCPYSAARCVEGQCISVQVGR